MEFGTLSGKTELNYRTPTGVWTIVLWCGEHRPPPPPTLELVPEAGVASSNGLLSLSYVHLSFHVFSLLESSFPISSE